MKKILEKNNNENSFYEKVELNNVIDFLNIYDKTFYIINDYGQSDEFKNTTSGYLKWRPNKVKELKIIFHFIKLLYYDLKNLTIKFDFFNSPFLSIFLKSYDKNQLIDDFDELQSKLISLNLYHSEWYKIYKELGTRLDKIIFPKFNFKVSIETISINNLVNLGIPKSKIEFFKEKIAEIEFLYKSKKYQNCYVILKDDIYSKIILSLINIKKKPIEIMDLFEKVLNIKKNNILWKWINQSFCDIGEIRNGIHKGEINWNSRELAKNISEEWSSLNTNQKKLFTRLFIDNTKTLFNFLLEAKLLEKEIN